MIDYFFGNYLMKFNNIDISYNYVENRKLATVIVATKPSFWLPLVIKNALYKIKECNLYFFGSNESIFFIKNNLKLNLNFIEIKDIRKVTDYNKLLLDEKFWKTFNEEYVLIIQPDCLILRDVIKSDFNFDYIGALCGNFNNDSYILNGGLSMRKRDVMIEICENLNSEEKNGSIPEDIIFTQKTRLNNLYKFPTPEDCINFSIESIGNIDNVLGIHGTDKYYIHPNIKFNFVNYYLNS